MPLDTRLLAVLACPEDKGPLYYLGDDDGLYNPRLHRRYEVTRLMARIETESIQPTFDASA